MRVVNNMRSLSSCALSVGLVVIALVICEVSAARKKDKEDGKPSGRRSRGLWIGHDGHSHGWGWMHKLSDKHHGHSTKLSEAYVKFHGLGEKGNKGNSGGILGRLGNFLSRLSVGRGDPDEDGGWGSNNNNNNDNSNSNNNNNNGGGGWGGGGGGQQQMIAVAVQGPPPPRSGGGGGGHGGGGGGGGSGSSGGGWAAPPSMMQMQSGWANPQMQMVVAQPTGWASAQGQQSSSSGGSSGGSKGGNGGNNRPAGWATGDFSSFKPPRGGNNNNKGHFQLNFPTGKPAYIQKLTPLIDLPKVALHGWQR